MKDLKLLAHIKARLGELWWYALVLFCVQRIGDVINVFIGLWLVPKYVPQAELGAVLPLVQIGSVLGLPLAVLLIPFGKFVNVYATRGEFGKVKRLLRDVFLLAAVTGLGLIFGARYVLPYVFTRMRVESGLLVWLIVISGVTTTLMPLFTQALQALKRFRALSLLGVVSAGVRLLVLIVTLPIRGISGYFCGQIAAGASGIIGALIGLRTLLSKKVHPQPYLHHWREILNFTLPVAVLAIGGRVQSTAEFFVIRHRLPDVESAAYYFITRFAELSMLVWAAIGVVYFPLMSERHERGEEVISLFKKAMVVVLISGGLVSLGLHVGAPHLFAAVPKWAQYVPYASLMGVASITCVLQAALACFVSHEVACRRFRFVWFTVSFYMLEAFVLYAAGGIGYFNKIFPSSVVVLIESFELMRLKVIVWIIFSFTSSLFGFAMFRMRAVQRLKPTAST